MRPYSGRHAARPALITDRRLVRQQATERVQQTYTGKRRAQA